MIVQPRLRTLDDAIPERTGYVAQQGKLLMELTPSQGELPRSRHLVGPRAVQHVHVAHLGMPAVHAGEVAHPLPHRVEPGIEDR